MQPGEFVRTVLGVGHGIEGFARFVVVEQGKGWPGKVVWLTHERLAQIDPLASAEDILGRDLSSCDVFFTPHLFTRTDIHVTKSDVVKSGVVSWLECDDADVTIDTLVPRPSMVVETSPGRHHFYWLFSEPQPTAAIETLNWQIVQGNRIIKDVGGWHLVKYLRLPATRNHKREGKPTLVRSMTTVAEPVYEGVKDTRFDPLPEVPEDLYGTGGVGVGGKYETGKPLPLAESFIGRDVLASTFSLNSNILSLLDETSDDRSAALWRIYNHGRRLGMEPAQTYWLVRSTSNDKFSQDLRYNADTELWHDILRAYSTPINSLNTTPIRAKIAAVLAVKGVAREKHHAVAQAIFDDLVGRGRVYYDEQFYAPLFLDTSMSDKEVSSDQMQRVITIDPRGKAWAFIMASRYGISDSHPEFRPVTSLIAAAIQSEGNFVQPHRVAHFSESRNCLYVYNNGRSMYKLDGVSVSILDNGAEGVLFRDTAGAKPFAADLEIANGLKKIGSGKGGGGEVGLMEAIFTVPNFTQHPMARNPEALATPLDCAQLAQGWVLSMFFPELMSARPHLVITGPTASGKTMFFQLVLELFFGPNRTVTSIPVSKDAFENTVSNHHFIFYDNVDTPNAWFTDAIAEVATGIEFQRRILYTTNDNITVTAQCFVGMTTRDPWFSRTDVATRLVVLEVERRRGYADPRDLINRVRQHRDSLWGELLLMLNRMVARIAAEERGEVSKSGSSLRVGLDGEIDSGSGDGSSIRVAAFDRMLHVMAATNVGGPAIDADKLVSLISDSQATGALEHSALWASLESWIEKKDMHGTYVNMNRPLRAKELYKALTMEAAFVGTLRQFERAVASTRSLGRQLQELLPELRKRYIVEAVPHVKGFSYSFNPLDSVSEPSNSHSHSHSHSHVSVESHRG